MKGRKRQRVRRYLPDKKCDEVKEKTEGQTNGIKSLDYYCLSSRSLHITYNTSGSMNNLKEEGL